MHHSLINWNTRKSHETHFLFSVTMNLLKITNFSLTVSFDCVQMIICIESSLEQKYSNNILATNLCQNNHNPTPAQEPFNARTLGVYSLVCQFDWYAVRSIESPRIKAFNLFHAYQIEIQKACEWKFEFLVNSINWASEFKGVEFICCASITKMRLKTTLK